jgi:acetyl esterase/lipase
MRRGEQADPFAATREYAQRLRQAGVPCVHQEWVGGHENFWWRHTLPAALAWLLSSSAQPEPAADRTAPAPNSQAPASHRGTLPIL